MRTKIVYIVISDATDHFLEQALLSLYSLRMHHPDAYVELMLDQATRDTLSGKRSEITKYTDKITVVEVPKAYNKAQRSRWIKTSLRNLIDGNYLYIDNDTIVTDTLGDIDEFGGEIGAVRDGHMSAKYIKGRDSLIQWAQQDGWTYYDELAYFNSGVMFVKDCQFTHDFYREWNQRWQKSCEAYDRFFDQSPLAATNEYYHYPIKELSGEWNCQPANGLSFIYNAKIMHYWKYGRKNYVWMFYDKDIIEQIKETGYIPEETKYIVAKAKGAFIMPNMIIGGRKLELYNSPVFRVCEVSDKLFALFNGLSRLVLKARKIKRFIIG